LRIETAIDAEAESYPDQTAHNGKLGDRANFKAPKAI
jgi:hypothetical protein